MGVIVRMGIRMVICKLTNEKKFQVATCLQHMSIILEVAQELSARRTMLISNSEESHLQNCKNNKQEGQLCFLSFEI